MAAFLPGAPAPHAYAPSTICVANAKRFVHLAVGRGAIGCVALPASLWGAAPRVHLSLRASQESDAAVSVGKAQVLVGGIEVELDDKSLREAFERSEDDTQVTVCIRVEDAAQNRLDTFLSQVSSHTSLCLCICGTCGTSKCVSCRVHDAEMKCQVECP